MKECSKCRQCFDDALEVCPNDNSYLAFTISGPTTISGRYILESRLGQGGMGIVFKARHKFLKSWHAVKIILPSLVHDDKSLLVRFRQEAILAASIDHPNVIRVTDFGVENDVMPFLVMEFVSGTPLSFYLVDGKPLPLDQAYGLFIPAAMGVSEAHHRGIVHRDLKPQNIMVQKNLPLKKAIKVLDFGLAKIKSADSYPSLVQAKTLNILGSPPYMSPEQWSGEDIDHRTDIYSLAVILFQMLTGRLPFQADSMPAMMYQHLTVPPPTAASLGVSIPPAIEAVVQKALEKDADKRYSTLDEMLYELGQAAAGANLSVITQAETEYLIPPPTGGVRIPRPADTVAQLSDSQRKRFYSYFDSLEKPGIIPEGELAQEFLEAQDRAEKAKTQAVKADMLVQELVEAQKQAAEAQEKALLAKQRIEEDVRRQVEAEMERLVAEEQAKHEAEARRLADEVEARRQAEERANYLAQAALEAQQQAENERKRREEEAQQRELHEGVRRQAEIAAQQLAEQVAEAQRQYEEARNEAAREARFRMEAEAKQRKIEEDLKLAAENEAERRRLVEAEAQKKIQEQAERFEKEAQAAHQRLEEAQLLVELETQKREEAEAARIQAEEEAKRLAQEIVEVQRQMQEMQLHISVPSNSREADFAGVGPSGAYSAGGSRSFRSSSGAMLNDTVSALVEPTHGQTGQPSGEIPFGLLDTGRISAKRMFFIPVALGVLAVLLAGGVGLGLYIISPPAPVTDRGNTEVNGTSGNSAVAKVTPQEELGMIFVPGGRFQMGSDDVPVMDDIWGNQYPKHSVPVTSFYIDKTETTNQRYAEFVAATKYDPPAGWIDGKPPAGQEQLPVTNVSLADANRYAAWVSKQKNIKCSLPTEEQWEYAARNGEKQTLFPWGNDWRENSARLTGSVAAVGASGDQTLNGIQDMLGNVSEWTASKYALYPGHQGNRADDNKYQSVRGLSWKVKPEYLKNRSWLLTFRYPVEDRKYDIVGFRLVCEP